MTTKQKQKSEETIKKIVAASEILFASKGYDSVTMREIAKEAGCSHTTIYIYFKDKEALLTHLSMPPLQALLVKIEALLGEEFDPEDILKAISLEFIVFCLTNRNTYNLFIAVKSVQVDDKNTDMELNQLRNLMFGKFTGALQACLKLGSDDQKLLMYSRILFFSLNGIVATYTSSEESVEQLMNRLSPTFDEAFEVMLTGFKHRISMNK
ncbi:hypothetical protein JCM10914A_50580 [Paenibacillus sp. JCM 10914]|uniref:TetR/AcrR family transcriptional regulator n=1 Tax=Paenibacillus sp. JCM 10914 TaxID=1236974 RepID=UPI0003CCBB32|nr:TetR/AcrR family transcriptional regulator [Paenibacillus sp. JCM 10914]GAE08300.1 hypothetical protein JCM10914_4590 [Paenibacillus sp. JCM 10914]